MIATKPTKKHEILIFFRVISWVSGPTIPHEVNYVSCSIKLDASAVCGCADIYELGASIDDGVTLYNDERRFTIDGILPVESLWVERSIL